jgi:hypothetical protein
MVRRAEAVHEQFPVMDSEARTGGGEATKRALLPQSCEEPENTVESVAVAGAPLSAPNTDHGIGLCGDATLTRECHR